MASLHDRAAGIVASHEFIIPDFAFKKGKKTDLFKTLISKAHGER
jgi:hypothetical protein